MTEPRREPDDLEKSPAERRPDSQGAEARGGDPDPRLERAVPPEPQEKRGDR